MSDADESLLLIDLALARAWWLATRGGESDRRGDLQAGTNAAVVDQHLLADPTIDANVKAALGTIELVWHQGPGRQPTVVDFDIDRLRLAKWRTQAKAALDGSDDFERVDGGYALKSTAAVPGRVLWLPCTGLTA